MEKEKKGFANVDEYIASFPESVRERLDRVRAVIHESAPEAEERISYQMPAFFINGQGLIWFGAYQRHIGVYPKSAEMLEAVPGLAAYRGTKSAVHFPLNQPLPEDLLRAFVAFRKQAIDQA